jgi:hypothetical protein
VNLAVALRGGVVVGTPDWIDGFGENGTNGEEGALRFDMAGGGRR